MMKYWIICWICIGELRLVGSSLYFIIGLRLHLIRLFRPRGDGLIRIPLNIMRIVYTRKFHQEAMWIQKVNARKFLSNAHRQRINSFRFHAESSFIIFAYRVLFFTVVHRKGDDLIFLHFLILYTIGSLCLHTRILQHFKYNIIFYFIL